MSNHHNDQGASLRHDTCAAARRMAARGFAAAALLCLSGCGALLTPSTLVSLGTSIIGGVANGGIMGGSVLGVIQRDQSEAVALQETEPADLATPTPVAAPDAAQSIAEHASQPLCSRAGAPGAAAPCS